MREIVVQGGHTPDMIAEEAAACLGAAALPLTLGQVMQLAAARSPFLLGGEVKDEDLHDAYCICGKAWKPKDALTLDELSKSLESGLYGGDGGGDIYASQIADAYAAFSDDLTAAIKCAWRAWEIVKPDESIPHRAESEVKLFSPEWMASVICNAAHALPSLTYHAALWEMPLVALVHLGDAEYRRDGGITRRDHGEREAIREYLRMLEEERKAKEQAKNG